MARFRYYGEQECRDILRALEPAVRAWEQRWFGSSRLALSVRNHCGGQDPLIRELRAAGDEGGLIRGSLAAGLCAGFAPHSAAREALAERICGLPAAAQDSASNDLALRLHGGLAGNCLSDLIRELGGATEPSRQGGLSETELRRAAYRGSGWAVLALAGEGFELGLLLAPALLQPFVPVREVRSAGKLDSAKKAVVSQRARINGVLGTTSLTIGQFKALAVGDVIRLDQGIDVPVQLVTPSGEEVARGKLGMSAGHRAIRLVQRDKG